MEKEQFNNDLNPKLDITKKILAKVSSKKEDEAGEFIEAKIGIALIYELTESLVLTAFEKLKKKIEKERK